MSDDRTTVCPHCGEPVSDEADRCWRCGLGVPYGRRARRKAYALLAAPLPVVWALMYFFPRRGALFGILGWFAWAWLLEMWPSERRP